MDKEKKEIGKLLELLNEYEIEREEKIDLFNDKEKPLWEWYKDCTGDLTFEPIDSKILNGEAFSGDTANSVIISKSYGFIGWLVENDKIDFRKADADISKDIVLGREPDFAEFMVFRRFADDEKVIMLLSISDTPIEDLISYLK